MTAGRVIDLNADLGEGAPGEEALFAAGITSANLACGGHAGDPETMRAACRRARARGVAVGAHPGYADRVNFGRRPVALDPGALGELLAGQLAALATAAAAEGGAVVHLKPHGALYHYLDTEPAAARVAVAAAAAGLGPGVAIFGPPDGALADAAREVGLRFVPEGFIDRGYRPDGTLIARGEAGALIEDEALAVAQALRLAGAGRVRTLCVHGDGPAAARLLAAVRVALAAAGFSFSAPA